ncbi:hypothetical protein FJ959_09790 [Mesorhizobium sp. B2-2-4]|uniref:hypothetical protein n=1 Tax=unclassified Mesorhizobium TaxID=325217 RepID=UPI00112E295B|nr:MULTISPECIES: hypothetical protein [unclassified Mesorhizobium]TPM59150.1 hypothetical protein FJ959_09790 [Mesorhizobium sp. B2-2-4]TPM67635.1 hypothetical protein FJ965_10930 [Mesorhizobium sp. B2-2-1]TPN66917.1 hypothetical protein FJ984_15795 [Mesorhizobium sp. B1-1-3]
MLTVATLLWQSNGKSRDFSRCYDETWVEKLYRGFRRNMTVPFRFIVYTDRAYEFQEPVFEIVNPVLGQGGYADCIRPYEIGGPMILCGLDTVIAGNVDHLAEYCLTAKRFALPRDPYRLSRACNGVALVPAGHELIGTAHEGENDMEWVRKFPHRFIDDEFPGHVVSFKGTVEKRGLGDARIVYFHGERKPHQLPNVQWIKEAWV